MKEVITAPAIALDAPYPIEICRARREKYAGEESSGGENHE